MGWERGEERKKEKRGDAQIKRSAVTRNRIAIENQSVRRSPNKSSVLLVCPVVDHHRRPHAAVKAAGKLHSATGKVLPAVSHSAKAISRRSGNHRLIHRRSGEHVPHLGGGGPSVTNIFSRMRVASFPQGRIHCPLPDCFLLVPHVLNSFRVR